MSESANQASDIVVLNEGSIYLLQPKSNHGYDWIKNNIGKDAIWHNQSLVVEHRFIEDIIDGIINDGLTVVIN